MDIIYRLIDSGSGGTEATDLIQIINGQDLKIHKLWYLVLDGILLKIHPTTREEVLYGTVVEFVNNYLSENGRQILIIG